MRKSILLAVIMAVAGSSTLADAKSADRRHRHAAREPQQIACTVIGCVPVPPGCGQTPGRTFSGTPTGGDVIVCPPGVAPFK